MSGPMFRKAAGLNAPDPLDLTMGDVYHAVRDKHGSKAADRFKIRMDFLNGSPIDVNDTTDARKKAGK